MSASESGGIAAVVSGDIAVKPRRRKTYHAVVLYESDSQLCDLFPTLWCRDSTERATLLNECRFMGWEILKCGERRTVISERSAE
jgi:hypothetical protein